MLIYTAQLPIWSTKEHTFATKLISYNIYREILFHKIASGYLLHVVQDGCSEHVLENIIVHKI